MQMNSQVSEYLTTYIADQLRDKFDPYYETRVDFGEVAEYVMELMYGQEEDHPGASHGGSPDAGDLSDPGVDGRARPSLLGVVPSPEDHQCGQFAYLGDPRSLTAGYVPAPRSCCAQNPPSPPGQAEAA